MAGLIKGVLVLFIAGMFFSCKKELVLTTDSSAKLNFSKDTILFDTVFTTVSSITKRFKVYNKNNNAVEIAAIDLVEDNGFATYRLNVDGIVGNHPRNIEIRANDSIFVFVEVTVKTNAAQLPFLIADSISFSTNGNLQKIQLVSYGQNAHFYSDSILTGNITWNNDLPYVIYGVVLIDSLSKLTINSGVKVYLHKDAIVLAKGTLEINGTRLDSVTFQGDRREIEYSNEPGQWNAIQFLPGSTQNKINYTTIKNSVYGVIAGTFPLYGIQPEVLISNSIIKYSTVTGIFGIGAKIKAFNNLIFSCGQYAFFTQLGGDYDLAFNTFAQTNNFTNRQTSAVTFSDYLKISSTYFTDLLKVNLNNNIIWGTLKEEYFTDFKHTVTPTILVENNLIRTTKAGLSSSNVFNKDPLFVNPNISLSTYNDEDYHLKPNSPAKGKGLLPPNPGVYQFDQDGVNRQNPPSIGCFEAN